MIVTVASAANWPIVGQICWLLGKVMNFIYTILDNMLSTDTGLVGLSIILYTIFVYTLMLPMTINQQKSSRMMAVINPEVQKIQKKYRNKRDQASMMKQQEEIQQVYDKYGTSMMGGCLPMLIQMPLLFALYPVIYDIERYVPAISKASSDVNTFLTIPDITIAPIQMIKDSGSFEVPAAVIIITAIALPVISGATQFLNIKLSQAVSGTQMDENNSMAGTMKTMNMTMPLEDLIEKNKDKAEKKAKKRSEKAERINEMAQMNARSLKDSANRQVSAMSQKERDEKLENARKNAEHAKPGSLASKANMVKHFNENN